MKKNKLTTKLVYVLIGTIIIYGLGISFYENIGSQRFTFSDTQEYKRGIFATNQINKVSESWIQWDIKYSDGTIDQGRTSKLYGLFKLTPSNSGFGTNSDGTPFGMSLVKSINDPKIIQSADFTVYSDFSQIGKYLCFGTPSMTIKQTVLVNGKEVKIPKQTIVYNELDARNILKGIGVKITPQFLESQIQLVNGPLKSGDRIKFILDAQGRFELTEVSEGLVSNEHCLTDVIADGYIEGLHSEYELIYGDPLDLLAGTFPQKQTAITDQANVVQNCVNGVCTSTTIQESPDTINKAITQADSSSCIALYQPVCASDGKTYSNQCVADSFKATTVYSGVCVGKVITDIVQPQQGADNPTGNNGIVGICNSDTTDCSLTSPEIQNYVKQTRDNEFKYTSFEFIMLTIIGIVIFVILISRLTGYKK